jgi:SAM-dependent methyltransferase
VSGPLERLPLDPRSPWWGEHRSRYRYAQPFAARKRVLDIACGTGFGSAMLVEAGAAQVVGVDLDVDGLEAAGGHFALPTLLLVQADGTALPFPDGAFDLVTSFESIEHVPDWTGFVRELRRVTRAGGVLVLSTPNVEVTSRYPRNPYHVHEFAAPELAELLGRFYARVEIRGQHAAPAYRVVPFLPGRERPRTFFDRWRLLAWKVVNRLPFAVKDRLALLCTGRHFYPTEADYRFEPTVAEAPVLLATCYAGEGKAA